MAISKSQDEVNTDILAAKMAEIFNTPPCKAGMRLKSEMKMAEFLAVSLHQIRTVLNKLESQGIIIRKKGSGTYLRKMPQAESNNLEKHFNNKKLNADSLLAVTQNTSLNKKILSSQKNPSSTAKRRTVELWSRLDSTTFCNQTILNAMIQEFSRNGHRLSMHSLYEEDNDTPSAPPKTPNTYLKQQYPCDGYIVAASWANDFLKNAGEFEAPIIFFHPGSFKKAMLQPMIYINTEESIGRALDIFIDEAFSKIAIFILYGTNHFHRKEVNAYNYAISQANLDYSQCILCPEDLNVTIERTMELAQSPDRPEAIYVADDYLMVGVYQGLKMAGLVPGKDIAVITHSNAETVLPGNINWSRFEFNLEEFGRLIASELLRKIQNPAATLSSLGLCAKWIKGDTHTIA